MFGLSGDFGGRRGLVWSRRGGRWSVSRTSISKGKFGNPIGLGWILNQQSCVDIEELVRSGTTKQVVHLVSPHIRHRCGVLKSDGFKHSRGNPFGAFRINSGLTTVYFKNLHLKDCLGAQIFEKPEPWLESLLLRLAGHLDGDTWSWSTNPARLRDLFFF